MTRVIQVTVSDEAAARMAEELKARDEWPTAALIEVLLRDRARMREALRAIRNSAADRDIWEYADRGLEERS